MATKKKTEVEAVEEVKEVEAVEEVAEVAEEAPKKSTKKSSKKKAEPVEEKVDAVEEPVVEAKPVEEPKEAPKKVEKKSEPSAASYKVTSNTGLYTFKGPGFDNAKGKPLAKGSVITVTEVKGNWGKVGQDRWILLGSNLDKI